MSQKVYNICDNKIMERTLIDNIYKTIKENNYSAFSCYDFSDFGDYKTISKCLERLEDKGEIRRIIPGIYDINVLNKYFGISNVPDINGVANAIARKFLWNICPTGNVALNILGLSTQISSEYVYLSDGPYREYIIGNNKLLFKHISNKEISTYSYKTCLLIQAIKAIGEKNIYDPVILIKLKNKLSKTEKVAALKETKMVTSWIRNIIVIVCEE